MIYEKSCGAVVIHNERDEAGNLQRYVLMIKHTANSHYSSSSTMYFAISMLLISFPSR